MSVQVTLYGLSFLIQSLDSEEVSFFERTFDTQRTPEELLDELKSAFSEVEQLSQDFSEVNVVFGSHYYTLVPSSLFDETKASEYLKFNTKILANDFVSHDLVEGQDIHVVYVPFVNINNYLYDAFGNFQYFHSATVLLKHLLNKEKYSNKTKVFLNVEKGWFDGIIISNGKVDLCNSYPYQSPEDFLYFTLFAFEQLKLNPDTVPVVLSGDIDQEGDVYEFLYKYIRNISFSESARRSIKNETPHKHFVLKVLS